MRKSASFNPLVLSALLIGMMPAMVQALAVRDHIAGMTQAMCAGRAVGKGGYPTIDGNRGVYMIGNEEELCIWDVAQERNELKLPVGNETRSYPRDGLVEYFTLATSQSDASPMRIKQEILIPSLNNKTPPLRLGQEVIIDLPIHSTQNGQSIYKLNEFIGLRLWASLLDGALSNFRNNSAYFVNGKSTYAGKSLNKFAGDYYNAPVVPDNPNAKGGFNANFNLDAELVLLKAPDMGTEIVVPAQTIGMVKIHSANYRKISGKIDFPISISGMSITFTPRTCEYKGDSQRTVTLHKIGLGHFRDKDEVASGGSVQLRLECDAAANVDSFVTFTDNSNHSNTSNILGLMPGNDSAKNVGLKIYMNESQTPVNFGPVEYNPGTEGTELQSIMKKNYAQQVGSKSTQAQVHNINLKANYVRINRNEQIKPGKVNSEMMFTFSYY